MCSSNTQALTVLAKSESGGTLQAWWHQAAASLVSFFEPDMEGPGNTPGLDYPHLSTIHVSSVLDQNTGTFCLNCRRIFLAADMNDFVINNSFPALWNPYAADNSAIESY